MQIRCESVAALINPQTDINKTVLQYFFCFYNIFAYVDRDLFVTIIQGQFDKFVELCNKSAKFEYSILKFCNVIYLYDINTLSKFQFIIHSDVF